MDRFLNLDERQPLSPMWETLIKDMVINGNQKLLDNYNAGKIKGRKISEKARAMVERSCSLDPFDFSDDAVNQHRASKFCGVLDIYREGITPRKFAGRAWWPQTNEGIIAAIIAEREARVVQGSGSTSKAAAETSKPALPRVGKTSRSRGEEDTWSTTAQPGGSSSRSSSKNKRQRRSK